MKKLLFITSAFLFCQSSYAQLTLPADGGSSKAMTGERIGLTDVTINYGRPALRGRSGNIWGKVVPEGFTADNNTGKTRMIPWRAGANENTTIEFSTDVSIEGKHLAAGRYGFFIAYGPSESILIFSKHNIAWGSFFYDEADDALRVNIKPIPTTEVQERLIYTFSDEDDSSATIAMAWDKLKFPFRVSTKLHDIQMASIDNEMKSAKGWDAQSQYVAALYYKEDNRLDEALKLITSASTANPNFMMLSAKSDILQQMGKKQEAEAAFKAAVNATTAPWQAHNYARTQLQQKHTDRAVDIFKLNYAKFPNTFTTNMGMARGLSATGNYKEALKYANKALPQAPDASNKASVEQIIKTLQAGKDING